MHPGTVLLVHGPLEPPDLWSETAEELVRSGLRVVAPRAALAGPPYAVGWIAATAGPVHATPPPGPLVVVGAGTAGPLLPALARTQRAARRQIGGYVFVDSTLPRPGEQSHLDLLRSADPDAADRIHDELHRDELGDPAAHAIWTEPLPPVHDWPDAPCGYIRTGSASPLVGPTEWWARSAGRRGWIVDDTGRGLAATLPELIARLAG